MSAQDGFGARMSMFAALQGYDGESVRLVFRRESAARGEPVFEETVEGYKRAASCIAFIFAAFAATTERVTVEVWAPRPNGTFQREYDTDGSSRERPVLASTRLGRNDLDFVNLEKTVVALVGELTPNVSIEGAA